MANNIPDSFIKLSSILTGFTEGTLTLALQTADYYDAFIKHQPASTLSDLLNSYSTLAAAGKTGEEIGALIMDKDVSGALTNTASALMIFWYTGQIQDLSKPPAPPKPGEKPKEPDWVIPGGNFYAQSLSWRAIQAHPSGVSNQKFGYWASKPADLKNYL